MTKVKSSNLLPVRLFSGMSRRVFTDVFHYRIQGCCSTRRDAEEELWLYRHLCHLDQTSEVLH